MALTDTQIRSLKPRTKPYKVFDGGGLYIEVTPKGSKLWRLKYRFADKEKRDSFGNYPKVSLKEARKASAHSKELIEQGIDPVQAKKAKKHEQLYAQANNFELVAREWHEKQLKRWSEGYSKKVLRSLERDLFPYLGEMPLDQISPSQLLQVLRRIEERGAIETAHRVKQLAGQVFRYAVATSRAQRDITPDLKGALETPQKKHFAAITEPLEVGRMLIMLDDYWGTPTVKAALKLAPLVFLRPIELRSALWSEINFEEKEWRIPGEKMKMGEDHIIPLSDQAISILLEQKLISGHWNNFVFPGARSPQRSMSENAVLGAMRNLGIKKEDMCGHGFRAMARTLMDEILEERADFIEHQLSHLVKGPLGRAYNRTTHLSQRREMMQKWADYLDELRVLARENIGLKTPL